jgi:hypothetical protein
MKSAALAIGYLIWCRHKHGLIASAVALAAMAVLYPALFAVARGPVAVGVSVAPLIVIFGFVLNACLFSEEAGSMDSGYPRALFVLPAKSATLAFWPMLYGSAVAAGLWIVTARIIFRSSGYPLRVWLPALALATLMCWLQGLAWMPLAVRWLRAMVVILTVQLLGAVPIWLIITERGTTAVLASVLIVLMGGAFVVGAVSVASDRRGRSWLPTPVCLGFARRGSGSRKRPFRSAAAAQFWYEWNCHGLVLPGYVALPFALMWICLFTFQRSSVPPLQLAIVLSILALLSAIQANAIGPLVARLRPLLLGSRSSSTFVLVRPITSRQILLAKLRMVVPSVLMTVAIVFAGTGLWIVTTNNVTTVSNLLRLVSDRYPSARIPAILALAAVLVPALTARQLTSGFPFVLTGRRWIADGASWAFAIGLLALFSAGAWLAMHPVALPRFYAIVPGLVVGLAVAKGLIAIAIYRAALKRRLLDRRDVTRILGLWLAFTSLVAGFAVLVELAVETPLPTPVLLLGAAMVVPLIRFPLATLALEWNRHR